MTQEEKRLTGLEEEIIRFNMVNRPINHSELGLKQWGEMVARHFYELGKQSGSSEIPNDLEEAAVEWSKENTRGFVLRDKTTRYVGDTIDAFIAGAKWQAANTPLPEDTVLFNKGVEEGKRLMMEEAVECELVCIKDRLAAILPMKEFQWTIGDKVRIIIVKEG